MSEDRTVIEAAGLKEIIAQYEAELMRIYYEVIERECSPMEALLAITAGMPSWAEYLTEPHKDVQATQSLILHDADRRNISCKPGAAK